MDKSKTSINSINFRQKVTLLTKYNGIMKDCPDVLKSTMGTRRYR